MAYETAAFPSGLFLRGIASNASSGPHSSLVLNGSGAWSEVSSVQPAELRSISTILLSKTALFSVLACIISYALVSTVVTVTYRLFFSPLARVPGPKIAAATRLYEFWYQGIQHTRFPHQIRKLHKQYGPLVRISPFEVSLNDSTFNAEFFIADHELEKDPWYYFFGFTNALFVLINKNKHKERQTIMANHLRGKYWADSFPMISSEIASLVAKFESATLGHTPLNLSKAYRKAGNEVLRNFLLGNDYDGVNSDSRDFGHKADTSFNPLFRSVAWVRMFPWLFHLEKFIPTWVLEFSMPLARYKREMQKMVGALIRDHDANGKPARNKSLFYQFIDLDPTYRDNDNTAAVEEFMELMWGGREVLGHAMSNISYQLLKRPECMERLHEELKAAPFDLDTATYAQLQTLPYLWAVYKEGLRTQLGGGFRIPRKARHDIHYNGHLIPAGTTLSFSPKFFHDDEAIFPEAASFKPERWLEGDVQHLEKFWNPFGAGSRSCAGRPMTYEILFRSTANIFSRYRIDWNGCDAEFCLRDGMMEAFPPRSSTGLRVSVSKWDD